MHRGGCIRGATTEARARRDLLAQRHAHAVAGPPRAQHQLLARPHRQVVASGRDGVRLTDEVEGDPSWVRDRFDLDHVLGVGHRHRERLELVEPVRANTADLQPEGELGVGRCPDTAEPARLRELVQRPASCATAAQAGSSSASARAVRVDAGCHQHVGRTITEDGAERAPQHLAPLREARTNELEHQLRRGDVDGRDRTTVESHEDGLDLRPRDEHRSRHGAHDPSLCVVRDASPTRNPYTRDPGAAASRSPTSRCTMTSIRAICGTSSSSRSTTGVATLYGRLETHAQPPAPSRGAKSSVERVAVLDGDVRRRSDDGFEHRHEVAVELDGEHVGTRVREREGQRAEPGADLEDTVVGTHLGEARDARAVFGSARKCCPSARLGTEPVVVQQAVHIRRRQHGHGTRR